MKILAFLVLALSFFAYAEPDYRYPIPDQVPFNSATRYGTDTQANSQGGTAVGTGAEANLAEGIQIKATKNTNIRLTASWDNASNSAIGAGITGGF